MKARFLLAALLLALASLPAHSANEEVWTVGELYKVCKIAEGADGNSPWPMLMAEQACHNYISGYAHGFKFSLLVSGVENPLLCLKLGDDGDNQRLISTFMSWAELNADKSNYAVQLGVYSAFLLAFACPSLK